jgi:hypothetical protein
MTEETGWQKRCRFTRMVAELLAFAERLKWNVALAECLRTEEQQEIYVKEGKSKTMNSRHLTGLAIDLVMWNDDGGVVTDSNDSRWKILGKHWEAQGGTWGGRFGDDPATEKIEGWDGGHFQLS